MSVSFIMMLAQPRCFSIRLQRLPGTHIVGHPSTEFFKTFSRSIPNIHLISPQLIWDWKVDQVFKSPSVVARTLKKQSIGPTTLIILAGVLPVLFLVVVVVNFVMCCRSRRRRRRWEKVIRKQRKDPELDSGEIREAVLTSHNTVQVEANSPETRPDTGSVIQDSDNNRSSRGHDRTSISVQLSRFTGSSHTDIGTPVMKKKFSRSSSMMRNDVGVPELEPGNDGVMLALETTSSATTGNQDVAEENAEPLMTAATAPSSSDHNEDVTETETNVDAEVVDSTRRATFGSVTTYETLPSYHTRASRATSSASFRSLPPLPPLQVPPLPSTLPPLPLPFSPFTTRNQSARTSMRRSSSTEFESAVATPLPTEEDAASSSTTPGHEVMSDEAEHEGRNRDTMNSMARTSSETLPSYRTRGSDRNTRGA
ncbi:hypothetical protein D9757_011113 [Collybiopsis confluens]|uniref:Uncharacterized protein n=1 Tax=Collybiopsis confluens TaxID=2823264 RepID=A0A8H5GWX3_9AGAR|nr:hypothetical protein D9757_011113 [Collybiopsis confluens]